MRTPYQSNPVACTFLVALLSTACLGSPDEAALADEELNGRVTHSSQSTGYTYVPPYPAAQQERAMFHARTVASSTAFAQCVQQTMDAQYMNCGADNNPTLPRSQQITEAWRKFREWDTHIFFQHNALAPGGAWSGASQSTPGTHGINTHEQWNPEQSWAGLTGVEPWHWVTDQMIHEFVHTIGYWHEENPVFQAECAARNGRASYYAQGEPSAPYIYGQCAYEVVDQSWDICGDIHAACPVGQLRMLSTWVGSSSTIQSSNTPCVCVRDPRHVIGLMPTVGNWLYATNGGGGDLLTNGTSPLGSWGWFYAYDLNGGSWTGQDDIFLKTHSGHFVARSGSTFRAAATTPARLRLSSLLGSTVAIQNGSQVTLRQGSYYGYSDGTFVQASTSSAGSDRTLTVTEPRRDHLVYIRTYHGSYINRDASMMLFNDVTDASLQVPTTAGASSAAVKASAAFWIVDWNGGDLRDGDWVSLESFQDDSMHYLSVRDVSLYGQARLRSAAGPMERFQINIRDGWTGAVAYSNDGNASNDHNRVSFLGSNGRYLVAYPPDATDYYRSQLMNYGTSEGPWADFEIVFVHEYDQHRPTW